MIVVQMEFGDWGAQVLGPTPSHSCLSLADIQMNSNGPFSSFILLGSFMNSPFCPHVYCYCWSLFHWGKGESLANLNRK